MTRASASRNYRRLTKKENNRKTKSMLQNNKCWDEVAQLEAALVGMMFSVKNIVPVLQNEELMRKMDTEKVMSLAKIIDNDMARFKDDLAVIQNKHKDKTGGSSNPDDVMEAISIGQEYQMISDRFIRLVVPNVDLILHMAYEAGKELDQEKGIVETPVDEPAEPATEVSEEVHE